MRDDSAPATRSFEARKRYLHFPVRNGAPMRRLTVSVGDVRHEFDIELADGDADWWAFFDLASCRGTTVTVTLDGEEALPALDEIHQSSDIIGAETIYQEARRPQLRFSSRRGWLNDPNGLVYYEGEYHLFYQHNPYGRRWGAMHWGHAVSRDLVHWEELPIALYPDALGPMFSGSAVVDWRDTAGFRAGADPALVAIYTAAGEPFTQCIAASVDRGRTWQKYEGNPVLAGLPPSTRDPKVFWHDPSEQWVMAIYQDALVSETVDFTSPQVEEIRRHNRYALFSSTDLKRWAKLSEFALPGDSECPELFELPVVGSPSGETRWVFYGALGMYLVGTFDGERFVPESGPLRLHEGDCFYASQTFTDIPKSDGRRILIAWGAAPIPLGPPSGREQVFAGMPFDQSMSLPVQLTLHDTGDGHRVRVNPVAELADLRRATTSMNAFDLPPGTNPLAGLHGELWEIDADIEVGAATGIVLDVRGVPVRYDAGRQELSCLERSASLPLIGGRLRLRVFVDRTAIDIFGQDGQVFMPIAVDLTANAPALSLHAEGGDAVVHVLDAHELASIWSPVMAR